MGSRSTKVALHAEAVASPVAPAQQHQKSEHTNEPGPCHSLGSQPVPTISTRCRPCDDISLASSRRQTEPSRRRYSEPAKTAAMATELNNHGARHHAVFESFVTERGLMAIDIVDETVLSRSAAVLVQEKDREAEEPEVQCIACCAQLPKAKDANYAKEVAKPCKSCDNAYCVSCVRDMFLEACKDFSRMPARCCTQIHLHYAKSYLTTEEVANYRSKYEEWSTPRPFYCPVPTCSVFIPVRLLSLRKTVDSGIGIPTSSTFQCPTCEEAICFDCRQMAHPRSLCTTLEFGVDPDTAALLKAWGYRRCPKCGQGIKRMYGCSHMECRCGVHFCWRCMKSRDECEGGCYDAETEDDESDFEPDEPELIPEIDRNNTSETQVDNDAAEIDSPLQAPEQDVAGHDPTASAANSRPRNLDGGSADYWEGQDLDFGEEPVDRGVEMAWNCKHSFEPYAISLAEAISTPASMHEAECVRCWCNIQPGIETPPANKSTSHTSSSPRNPTVRGHRGRRSRGRGNIARQRPPSYVPPRGLVRSDTTVGTAPHLTVRLASAPAEGRSDPMEGIQPGFEADSTKLESITKTKSTTSKSHFFSDPSTTYSVAQECIKCSLLVCKACADSILARRESREDENAAKEEIQPEEEEVFSDNGTEGRVHILAIPSDSDSDDQPSPSLFD